MTTMMKTMMMTMMMMMMSEKVLPLHLSQREPLQLIFIRKLFQCFPLDSKSV